MRVFENTDDLGGFLATQMATGTAPDRFSIDVAVADRSPILHGLADCILASGAGLHPIVVQPPKMDFDTGAVGLTQIADGLSQVEQDPRLAKRIADPQVSWAEKHREVSNRLAKAGKRIVLISEDPNRWFPPFGERRLFAERADEVAALLTHRSPCRTIVAGKPHDRLRTERVRLERASAVQSLVDGSREWRSLSETARLLHDRLGSELENFPPIEIGLLVALLHFTSFDDTRRLVDEFAPADRLAKSLVAIVQRTRGFEGVIDVWSSLALARRPFETSVVEDLVADIIPLAERVQNPTADDLIRCCLLQAVDRKVEVPSILKAVASELPLGPQIDGHGIFARHYAEKNKQGTTRQLLSDEMEAFHHASKAKDRSVVEELRPFFSDQLDAWGKSLSQQGLYDKAVEVFDRATAWDPEDDYAYHYSAFNLDVVGEQPDKVEANYSKAIELDPDNVWWRSRFICFLITRSRTSEARRAWSEALRALAGLESSENPFLYEHLHVWVARLLLHRMKLEFAKEVLDSIPAPFRLSMPKMKALDRHLRHLDAADRGLTVRPFRSPIDTRRRELPERAALRTEDRELLVRWVPGRIEEIDEKAIHIAVEMPDKGDGEPAIGRASIPRADFDRFSLDEQSGDVEQGRFIELAYYGSAKEPVIRVLRQDRSPDPDLPSLGFQPDRYLRPVRTEVE